MSKTYVTKSALALLVAAALAVSSAHAGGGGQPSGDATQSVSFPNLATDDGALEAWNSIGGIEAHVDCDTTPLPLSEFARQTCDFFTNSFDIIWPDDGEFQKNTVIKMRLKDVRAIEVFNAMNLYFEAQDVPAHWKLTLNGKRPTAILTLKKSSAPVKLVAVQERKNTVFNIAGPLYALGPDNLKQSAANIADALEAVLDDVADTPRKGPNGVLREGAPVIKIHPEAGILVFTGTTEQTALVYSALGALNDARLHKAEVMERLEKASTDGNKTAPK